MATIEGDETNNSLWGTDEADRMYGLGGNDKLRGGGGADMMFGGLGNDRYWVGSFSSGTGFDSVYESAGEGYDTVFASVSYILPDNVERLILTGTAGYGTGNNDDNRIVGNLTSNTLNGADGNDTLIAGGGQDHLYGGEGDDRLDAGIADGAYDFLRGEYGDDVYIVHDDRDYVLENSGNGYDTVHTSVDGYALPDNVERLFLIGDADLHVDGNDLDNRIYGNGGDNHLHGGAGNDTLFAGAGRDHLAGGEGSDRLNGSGDDGIEDILEGGPGDDQYVILDSEDQIVEEAGGGYDTVRVKTAEYSNFDHVERIVVQNTGTTWIDGAEHGEKMLGNEHDNEFLGFGGDDVIRGRGGDDLLSGGTGDDWLIADGGQDDMVGGDPWFLDPNYSGDPTWENHSAGADRYVIQPLDGAEYVDATIHDFSLDDGDRIVLKYIDADPSTPEDDAFVFRGFDGPTGEGAEVWFELVGDSYLLVGTLADGSDAGFEVSFETAALDLTQMTEAHFVL